MNKVTEQSVSQQDGLQGPQVRVRPLGAQGARDRRRGQRLHRPGPLQGNVVTPVPDAGMALFSDIVKRRTTSSLLPGKKLLM